MLRNTMSWVLLLALHQSGHGGPPAANDTVSSPLSSYPAQFEYVTNNAPFVVFDIAPRSLNGPAALKAFRELELTFVATDPLHRVDITTYVVPPGGTTRYLGFAIGTGGLNYKNWALRIQKIQRRLLTATHVATTVENRVLISKLHCTTVVVLYGERL